ncbi:glutamate ABC transporter substrate-binding protein [Amycolatopsis roodepoortensis]|uniref:Polar amino acid transport system substrate-binding protein n=1 Tax=Amycolatopsis roodepoortensis TaxID=700274 RepID=A0ABR9LKQ1_9PSEU|nr:glutamate ABC transporter substrate-binding protein [Amycolatopsis roodepoortensis]MBE1581256.1 polar amino acid transport system substrate-binding protein [Amycolatopsis roodepoortensis]
MRNGLRTAVLGAVLVLATACGSAGAPVDPAPVGEVAPPLPANVGGADNAGGGGTTDTSCNPLASLRPTSGTSITSGSTMAKIKEKGKLVAGVDQTTFLFGFRNPTSGQLEGFDIDMVNEIAKAIFGSAEGRVQFRAIPSKLREDVLEKKQVDIVVRTYSITCSRLKKVNFSTAYYQAGQRILVESGSKVANLSDLGGRRVCATKTSTSLTKIAADPSKPVPVSVDNWSDCLVMLQQKQVEAVSTDDVILAGMLAQDPTLKIVGSRFTEENYGIGIPKENEDMVRFVNAVLENVRGGAWQTSYAKWIGSKLEGGTPPPAQYK